MSSAFFMENLDHNWLYRINYEHVRQTFLQDHAVWVLIYDTSEHQRGSFYLEICKKITSSLHNKLWMSYTFQRNMLHPDRDFFSPKTLINIDSHLKVGAFPQFATDLQHL